MVNLKGIFTALVTPFTSDGGAVDYASLESLLDNQCKSGISGLVVCGSTGEAATLTDAEYRQIVGFVREYTRAKMPCIAGISVSSTTRAVEIAMFAKEVGCDGVLVATPPYNKPSQDGIAQHFYSIHAATGFPIVAYNIPGRSGVAISPATLGRLSHDGTIVGIKESSGSVDALADTMNLIRSDCQVVSGDDSLTLAVLAYGGVGAISAASNVLPQEMSAMVKSWEDGDAQEARRIQLGILGKIRALFVESNPVPVKAVLAGQGIIAHATVRAPLVSVSDASLEKIKAEFDL